MKIKQKSPRHMKKYRTIQRLKSEISCRHESEEKIHKKTPQKNHKKLALCFFLCSLLEPPPVCIPPFTVRVMTKKCTTKSNIKCCELQNKNENQSSPTNNKNSPLKTK